jgi:hypothetical protein
MVPSSRLTVPSTDAWAPPVERHALAFPTE